MSIGTHRQPVIEMWQLWKDQHKTFDLAAVLALKGLAGDDGVNGRLEAAVLRRLPTCIHVGTVTCGTSVAAALLRSIPEYLVAIQQDAGLDAPYDFDQVQYYSNFYQDFTQAVLREAALQMLISKETSPLALQAVLQREFSPPNYGTHWMQIGKEFADLMRLDMKIVYNYG